MGDCPFQERSSCSGCALLCFFSEKDPGECALAKIASSLKEIEESLKEISVRV